MSVQAKLASIEAFISENISFQFSYGLYLACLFLMLIRRGSQSRTPLTWLSTTRPRSSPSNIRQQKTLTEESSHSTSPKIGGIRSSLMNPASPVTQYDARPAVRDLLDKHLSDVAAVRALVANDALYKPAVHDNLWLLRFVLSHSKHEEAARAAKATMQYRFDSGFDQGLATDPVKNWPGPHSPQLQKFFSLVKDSTTFQCYWPDYNRGPLLLIDLKKIDGAMEKMTFQENLEHFMHFNEWTYQVKNFLIDRSN
jgi:hypothetical protein